MPTRKSVARTSPPDEDAERLLRAIQARGDYAHVFVRKLRGQLHVYAGQEDPVAKLIPLGGGQYGLSFHSHTGKWEPLPSAGDLTEVAAALVDALGIYLERWDFPRRNNGSAH